MSAQENIIWTQDNVISFFERSELLDHSVLRPISHVAPNWELTWNERPTFYLEEEGSLAAHLNVLIQEISEITNPPEDYHTYENALAKLFEEVQQRKICLRGKIWVNASTGKALDKDYVGHMIEQATAGYDDLPEIVFSASGRVFTAMKHGVRHFDKLDWGHLTMLSIILTTIIFRRSDYPAR